MTTPTEHPPADRIELLRFTTAGSVDDGKSTLIGRLLHDSKSIFEDQLEALQRSADLTGGGEVNLANLTDGLRAEREQGITIDVAYRYFATPRRKFIVADTPGHVQYTRNMVTGASTANLAIILIDARKGVIEQTRRHAYLASLLGIPHLLVCVNKMDLVDYNPDIFLQIEADFSDFGTRLATRDITFIPVSALKGDNIVTRSQKMDWYQGPTLLNHLEEVYIANDRNLEDGRLPVQCVIRPLTEEHHDFRGFAGQIAGGVFKVGDEVVALPSGLKSRVTALHTFEGALDLAYAPMSVTMRLKDEIDISRGDMIVHADQLPHIESQLEAMLCWMDDQPLNTSRKYLLKHNSHTVRCMVRKVEYRVDIENLQQEKEVSSLALNEIGRCALRTTAPLIFDAYTRNRQTGSFILIDEVTHRTVAAGMICEPLKEPPTPAFEEYVI
jgi:sulfate adenylyltransferase large subunit